MLLRAGVNLGPVVHIWLKVPCWCLTETQWNLVSSLKICDGFCLKLKGLLSIIKFLISSPNVLIKSDLLCIIKLDLFTFLPSFLPKTLTRVGVKASVKVSKALVIDTVWGSATIYTSTNTIPLGNSNYRAWCKACSLWAQFICFMNWAHTEHTQIFIVYYITFDFLSY